MLDNMKEIGERIKIQRESLGINQKKFAERIHIDSASLSRYEKGKQTPNLETIVMISNGLGVSLDYLIFGNGETANKIEEGRPYTYNLLKSFVLLITSGFISVKNDSSLAVNIKPDKRVIKFIGEIMDLGKIKSRLEDSAFNKSVEDIIKDYQYIVAQPEMELAEYLDYNDYACYNQHVKNCKELLKSIISEHKPEPKTTTFRQIGVEHKNK